MQQRFIEYDLPLAEMSEESAREKNIRHGHPSTLHIWWARRPLAASRATTFAALIDDPGAHILRSGEEIRKLIEQISPWEAVKEGNSAAIGRAEMIAEQYGAARPRSSIRSPAAARFRWRRSGSGARPTPATTTRWRCSSRRRRSSGRRSTACR